MRQRVAHVLAGVWKHLDSILARGLALPFLRESSHPAVAFDGFLVPDGLVAVSRRQWRIPVFRPGNWRDLLQKSNTSLETFLLDWNVDAALDADFAAAVQWLQKRLHMILWLPSVVSEGLPFQSYARFPTLPAQPGHRGDYLLVYVRQANLGVILCFWQELAEDGDARTSHFEYLPGYPSSSPSDAS